MWKLRKIEWAFVILGIIGIISLISANPSRFIIPIVVLGAIFLLYKFPPRSRSRSRGRGSGAHHRKRARKTQTHLYVIKGNKKDDDEPPRYH